MAIGGGWLALVDQMAAKKVAFNSHQTEFQGTGRCCVF